MSFREILETRPNTSKARLPALYADFRPLKKNNPEGYDANIQVWESALSTALKDGVLSSNENLLVLDITPRLLSDVSTAPWGRPLGIGSVVHESVLRGDWIPLETFLSESESIYERSWTITGAVGWIWRKIVEYSSGSNEDFLPGGRFVILSNLEEAASVILKHANHVSLPYADHIYSPETFAHTFSSLFPRPLTKLDQLILLKHLSRDKKEISCSPKFRSSNNPLKSIMDTDIHIAQLKTVELSLTEQISLLDSQYHSFTEKAKQAASNKNRIAALSALRSRKLSESALQRRSDALGRIQEVLHGVEQAASHAGIIKALEGGAKALENLNKEIGGIEKVEKVMDRIRDGLEETEDVGRIIAEIGNSKVDELEVQEEFDEMLKASEEEKRRQKEEEERIEVRRTEQPAVTQTEKTNLAEDMKNVSLDEQRTLEKGILEEPILS